MEGTQADSVREDQCTPELPEDLIFHNILSELPAKSLMRFKCVSESWRTCIIDDSSFINTHQNCQQTKNGPLFIANARRNNGEQTVLLLSDQTSKGTEVEVSYVFEGKGYLKTFDTCNGLVCLSIRTRVPQVARVLLWNPATRQLRELPVPIVKSAIFPDGGLGFGFDVKSKDYKVVQLSVGKTSSEEEPFLHAQVFDKSGTSWRDCETSLKIEDPCWIQNPEGVEGFLHWVFLTESGPYLVTFDLRDEVLRSTDGSRDCGDNFFLCKWNDLLAAFTDYSKSENFMWASTYSGGVRNWNKIFPVAFQERNFEVPENCHDPFRRPYPRDYVESMVSLF